MFYFYLEPKRKRQTDKKKKKNKQTVLWCNFCFSQPNRKKNINARRRECESARGSVRRVKHTNGIESFYYFDQSRFDTHLLFAPAGYKLNLSCIRYSHFHFQLTIIWNQAHEERESIHLKSNCENNLLAWYEFWFHIFLSTLNVWYNLINKYFVFFLLLLLILSGQCVIKLNQNKKWICDVVKKKRNMKRKLSTQSGKEQ